MAAETPTTHVYEVRPRKDGRGVDLISEALPFGRLWYSGNEAVTNAIGYAKFFNRAHDRVIRVFAQECQPFQTHDQAPDFKEP
jgi:hypothetical protein